MAECLCSQCSALCCRYFALPLDNPRTRNDYDDIRWYLCHENVVVFIEKRQWYIGILTKCKHLLPDNRCGIYEKRPRICREYSTDNCDYHGGEYDFAVLFTSADQLHEYAEKKLAGRRKTKRPAATKGRTAAKRKRPTAALKSLGLGRPAGAAAPGPRSNGSNGNGRGLSLPLLRK